MAITLEWLVGIAMALGGIGMGMFYAINARIDKSDDQKRYQEQQFALFRQYVAENYVRLDGMTSMRVELKSAIQELRAEWMADTQRRESRAERSEQEIMTQLATIKDSMARLAGDKRTRAGDV
jgi:hypothetical protein